MKKIKKQKPWTLQKKVLVALAIILVLAIVCFLLWPILKYIFILAILVVVQIVSGLTGQPGFT